MIRKTFFWIHLSAGLLAAIPLVAMAITGILLAFEPQIVDFATRQARQIPSKNKAPLPLDSLVFLSTGDRASKVWSVSLSSQRSRSVELRLGGEERLRIDPWSGEVKRQGEAVEAVFGGIENIHRWFGSREVGGWFTGIVSLLCLVVSATGLVVWWPRKLAGLRHIVWPRKGLRGKVRDRQWHGAVGILVLPLLATIALTGSVMAWKWMEAALDATAGASERSYPPVQYVKWQVWMDTASAHAPKGWTSVRLTAPKDAGSGPSALFRVQSKSSMAGGSVAMGADGRFLSWEPSKNGLGTRIDSFVKPLHTGELFGWVGQLVMALASAGAILLVWTGVSLSWRRFRRNRA